MAARELFERLGGPIGLQERVEQLFEVLVADQEDWWSALGPVHGQHCAVDWRSSEQQLLSFLERVGVLNLTALLLSEPVRWRPRAQALGPPRQVDRQALLQVFRM